MTRRLRTFVLAQVVAVGALVGFWVGTLGYEWGFRFFDPAASGPGAIWTARALEAAIVIAPVAALAGPRALVVLRRADSRRWPLDPWLAGLVVVGLLVGTVHYVVPLVVLAFVLPVAVCLALLALGVPRWRASDRWRPAHEHVFRGVALVGLLLVAAFAGGVAGAHGGDALTTDVGLSQYAAFTHSYEAVDDERGRLTITHDRGDSISPDRLALRGSGFADVPDVDHTDPGAWNGDASTPSSDGDAYVLAGDSVTVGVERDCSIRLVYTLPTGNPVEELDRYDCSQG